MGRGMKKVSDEVLVESYGRLHGVWKVGKEVGLCGQSVHERLVKIGAIVKQNIFTETEKEILQMEYVSFRDEGRLADLACIMGRTKQFICRKAKDLGLTDHHPDTKPWLIKPDSSPYARFHSRVRKAKGSPHKCELCGEDDQEKKYDWANLSGKYEDPDDYKRMCIPCHRKYDKNRIMLAHKRVVPRTELLIKWRP